MASHDREEIFEGIPELFGVSIVESVDLSEEHHDRIRITEWEIGILEYLFEKIGKVVSTRKSIKSLDIEIGTILIRELGIEQLGPSIFLIVISEKLRIVIKLSTHTILVIHELVDESVGNLVDLSFWVWYLSNKDISTGIDSVFGSGVEHKKV